MAVPTWHASWPAALTTNGALPWRFSAHWRSSSIRATSIWRCISRVWASVRPSAACRAFPADRPAAPDRPLLVAAAPLLAAAPASLVAATSESDFSVLAIAVLTSLPFVGPRAVPRQRPLTGATHRDGPEGALPSSWVGGRQVRWPLLEL